MAIEYDLVLAGGTPVEQAAERAFPDIGERPVGSGRLLAIDLNARYGFAATVLTGKSR